MTTYDERRAELLELGRQVDAEYEPGFMRGGRPLTNIEMHASQMYSAHQARERLESEGCCGCPFGDVDCRYGYMLPRRLHGRCPQLNGLQFTESWMRRFLEYLEEMECQQTQKA